MGVEKTAAPLIGRAVRREWRGEGKSRTSQTGHKQASKAIRSLESKQTRERKKPVMSPQTGRAACCLLSVLSRGPMPKNLVQSMICSEFVGSRYVETQIRLNGAHISTNHAIC